ncbi:MAG TPA: cytidine deaminase [Thermoplasmata archaeon]|nr:cytidine deaminase [Thermoplasmata archaeon]
MASRRRAPTSTKDRDDQLIEAARSVLIRRFKPGWHSVGAALRGKSGRIYAAVNLNAKYVGRVDVCAEAVVLGMAIAAGETGLDTVVAVQRGTRGSRNPRGRIVPPCGVCREMFNDYAPNLTVLLAGPKGSVVRRRAEDLLPDRYVDP